MIRQTWFVTGAASRLGADIVRIDKLGPPSALEALSAASPYFEGVDTQYACCRLNAVNNFPLSGHMPENVRDWYGFEAHIAQLDITRRGVDRCSTGAGRGFGQSDRASHHSPDAHGPGHGAVTRRSAAGGR